MQIGENEDAVSGVIAKARSVCIPWSMQQTVHTQWWASESRPCHMYAHKQQQKRMAAEYTVHSNRALGTKLASGSSAHCKSYSKMSFTQTAAHCAVADRCTHQWIFKLCNVPLECVAGITRIQVGTEDCK